LKDDYFGLDVIYTFIGRKFDRIAFAVGTGLFRFFYYRAKTPSLRFDVLFLRVFTRKGPAFDAHRSGWKRYLGRTNS